MTTIQPKGGFVGDGGVIVERVTEIAYMPTPDADQWAAAMADADETRSRSLTLYTAERMQEMVTTAALAVYEIWYEAERIGSMALETADWNGETIINVVWLKVTPGTFNRTVKQAIRDSWRAVAVGFDYPRFTVQGRSGWEHILIEQGLSPAHLSSTWLFESEGL